MLQTKTRSGTMFIIGVVLLLLLIDISSYEPAEESPPPPPFGTSRGDTLLAAIARRSTVVIGYAVDTVPVSGGTWRSLSDERPVVWKQIVPGEPSVVLTVESDGPGYSACFIYHGTDLVAFEHRSGRGTNVCTS